MNELVNIIYFLTKQNVQKDMQKEILKYYKYLTIRFKGIILFLENTEFYYLYNETNKINWVPLFEYLFKSQNHVNYTPYIKVKCYDCTGMTLYDINNKYTTYHVKDLLKILMSDCQITNDVIPFSLILGKPNTNVTLKMKHIEF